MALQAVLDKLDGLDSTIAGLYIEKDGKFHLNVEGGEKKDRKPGAPDNSENWIPKSRFDEVNEKRKSAEETLKSVVDGLKEDIPEEMRDLVPDIAPTDQIKWIRNAQKKGLFGSKVEESGPDSKRPGGTAPKDFKNMSPQAIMATGYKTK